MRMCRCVGVRMCDVDVYVHVSVHITTYNIRHMRAEHDIAGRRVYQVHSVPRRAMSLVFVR